MGWYNLIDQNVKTHDNRWGSTPSQWNAIDNFAFYLIMAGNLTFLYCPITTLKAIDPTEETLFWSLSDTPRTYIWIFV